MTQDVFEYQLQLLKTRFGDRAFDEAFTAQVAAEVASMSNEAFVRLVNVLIGTRAHNRPPLIVDFREARIAEQNRSFQREVAGASNVLNHPANSEGLKRILNARGVESLAEAIENERLRMKRLEREGKNGA